ncbi:uncharacterized protein K444DRAFT_211100 [Hyaloscypha bicolor E]|uniref:Uncharacterized protein n=1 Tax=Hyaloscypha bicolor E TaxID=1095630 RepID=A0A2J6TPR7_9HELO|nr:uncharacterized protein K444DRAFT_211100 [Hyaloscypha bicolor E]PMD65014.1 hypothetical protein K444DRAFT_211100 [Hyaloscypha bicolor E]
MKLGLKGLRDRAAQVPRDYVLGPACFHVITSILVVIRSAGLDHPTPVLRLACMLHPFTVGSPSGSQVFKNGIRCYIFTHLYGSRELALLLLHWRYVAGRLQPTPRVPNTQPTRHSILWALLFGVAFYTAGLPTFFLSDAHLRPMPGFETIRWLTRSSLHMGNQARFM